MTRVGSPLRVGDPCAQSPGRTLHSTPPHSCALALPTHTVTDTYNHRHLHSRAALTHTPLQVCRDSHKALASHTP